MYDAICVGPMKAVKVGSYIYEITRPPGSCIEIGIGIGSIIIKFPKFHY